MMTRYVWFALLLLLLVGCGGKSRLSEDPDEAPKIPYDRVWVDPRVTFSDSLITLVHAFRVDSIPAEFSNKPAYAPPEVEFEVLEFSCPVVVNLLDANQNVVYPLLRRDLGSGYYRLTFEPRQFRAVPLLPGIYYLRAQGCGVKQQTRFVFQ